MSADGDEAMRDLSALERDAHAWVRRLTSGTATAADAEALREWCGRSAAHASAFASASWLWRAVEPANRMREEARAAGGSAGRRRSHMMARRAFFGGALAASAAGVLIARPPLSLWPSISELRADFRTGVSEQRAISVSDGVTVEMNARTSLSVAADEINLIAGEASFTAQQGRARPFAVIAGNGKISTINGRFDVRCIGGEVRVTCFADQLDVVRSGRSTTLGPGQRISYGGAEIGKVVPVDTAVASAWQRGLMIFDMAPLSEVIDELNRYRPGRIILLDRRLAGSAVNGRFRIDRPDDALAQIELAFNIRRRSFPGGLVLLG